MDERFDTLADLLDKAGAESHVVRQVGQDKRRRGATPPTLVRKVVFKAKRSASDNWTHVLGELEESKEALRLLLLLVRERRALDREERHLVLDQMLDWVRAVPAGFVAAMNWMLPLPGTTLWTPWLLGRLGLLPSRWREARLREQLRKEQRRLRNEGHYEAARGVAALQEQLETEDIAREFVATRATLLTQWDTNRNGVWDLDEIAAYKTEVSRVRDLACTHGAARRWYVMGGEEVFGPVALTRYLGSADALPLVVCFEGRTGWVSINDLADETLVPNA